MLYIIPEKIFPLFKLLYVILDLFSPEVTPGAVSNLRSVRQLAIRCLSIFFERFPEQDFGLHTLDNSFQLAIVPQVTTYFCRIFIFCKATGANDVQFHCTL